MRSELGINPKWQCAGFVRKPVEASLSGSLMAALRPLHLLDEAYIVNNNVKVKQKNKRSRTNWK